MTLVHRMREWFALRDNRAHAPCRLGACRQARQLGVRLRKRRARAVRDLLRCEQSLTRAIAKGLVDQILCASAEVARAAEVERLLGSLDNSGEAQRMDAAGRRLDVVVSSLQLVESFRYCTECTDEGMHFLIGIDLDDSALVTGMRTFPYESRSAVHATADHNATHRIVRDTHNSGHRLLLIVHSHPGRGANANYRSSRDIECQRKWEPWNRQIGGIWSRDGFVRFFSWQLPFAVRVIGSHLEQVEDDLWRMTDAGIHQTQDQLALCAPEETS